MPKRILNLFRNLVRKRAVEQELNDELRSSLEILTQEKMKGGLSQSEARREALIELGGVEQVKEEVRAARAGRFLEDFARDIRFALRTLAKSPGFTAVAILTLALGIGATTALFTVVWSVLLKPLPFKDPGRLVALYERSPDGKVAYGSVAGGVFAEWKKQSRGFSSLAILAPSVQHTFFGAGGALPEVLRGAMVSWNLFPTLGVAPALGRGFTAQDDQPSANETAVLSWGFWKRRFGGNRSILGQTINLDGQSYTVIGVMPSWFAYPDASVELWTPVSQGQGAKEMRSMDPSDFDFAVVGRLKPGVTEKAATAQLSVITKRLHDQHLDDPLVSKGASSRPLLEAMVGNVKTPLFVLLAATGCLLLIACLNVTGLLVARGAARRREMAIRSALGGTRRRLFGQHLTESLLLSAAGGGAGILVADAVVRWFVAARPDMSRVDAIQMDVWVAVFVVLVICGCALFACLASSPSVGGSGTLAALQESSRSQSEGHGRARLRKTLLTLEVGLTVILLVGAGLLLRSYQRLRSTDLGCITKNVLTMGINLPPEKYTKDTQRVTFFKSLLEGVRALPGVEGAGLVLAVPGQGFSGGPEFTIPEHPPLPFGKGQSAIIRWADPGYFAALGIPFLHGHTFDPDSQLEKSPEAIISQSFARQYFPGEDPIGKHLVTMLTGRRSFRIVGIVGDTRYLASEPPRPIMYFSIYADLFNRTPNMAALAVHSSTDVTSLSIPIQRIVQRLDPELAVSNILTMNQLIGKSTRDVSFDAALLVAFAVLSLTLAAVGLFGVVSYLVNQRTHEIGIRMALGAQKSDVLRLVIGQGMAPALAGLGFGIAGSLALTRFLSSLLYGVKATDPLTFVAVSLLLTAVAFVACYIPARRATKVDPIVALRYE